MLRREVSATQHRLVMVARYLPQNGPKTQKFDFLARMPIKNIFETSFQTSALRLSKWCVQFFWVIFLRLDSTLTMCVGRFLAYYTDISGYFSIYKDPLGYMRAL